MAAPGVDLVIAFRATSQSHLSKQQIRAATTKAEEQYTNLIETLRSNGLRAAGRRGEALGHLLVFVSSPDSLVQGLVKRERLSDFLHGLPVMPMGPDSETKDLSEADRLRLVHAYVTCTTDDGGLGIVPGSEKWDLVESVLILHDKEWNDTWVHHWTPREIASVQLDGIRQRFGDAVALYFAFLSSYTKALAFPAGIGALFYFYGTPYSPTYSFLVAFWSIVFVEWWRVQEQLISLRFGTRGSFKVEKRRADYKTNFSWWQRELRMLASVPALLTFAGILAALLTGIFVFEAFVTHLYTGPGAKYLGFSPTILFVGIIPRVVALWSNVATKLTKWENHAHHSSYAASLTLKTFALSAIVAYLGLGLSAFVYVPFGEALMQIIQTQLFHTTLNGPAESFKGPNSTMTDGVKSEKVVGPSEGFWDMDKSHARTKLNPGRLKDQMFAYTVTNQIVNTFTEVGLPFIMRGGMKLFKKGGNGNGENNGSKKKVVFEDEKEKGGVEEKEFLENVRAEAALPEFDLFQEYSEMVTQFGYVALWSTIWPLAPVMAMFNNFLELRSDAFKMTVHHRRPIPVRTDTIGPWLNALTFLSWLAALTNSALVYLFCPRSHVQCPGTSASNAKFLAKVHEHLASASGAQTPDSGSDAPKGATTQLLMMSLLIALAASHGYIILRVIVRHVIVRAFWKGSKEVAELEAQEKEIKTTFINTTLAAQGVVNPGKAIKQVRDVVAGAAAEKQKDNAEATSFWDNDEGLEEITRISKEA